MQQLFVGQTTTKAPSFPLHITPLIDVPNMFHQASFGTQKILTLNARLRSALVQTSIDDLQPKLWQEEAVDCKIHGSISLDECYDGGPSFKHVSKLQRPYIAQLCTSMHPGLYEQYVPQINKSVLYTPISQADFAQRSYQLPSGRLYTQPSVAAEHVLTTKDNPPAVLPCQAD